MTRRSCRTENKKTKEEEKIFIRFPVHQPKTNARTVEFLFLKDWKRFRRRINKDFETTSPRQLFPKPTA